MKTIEQKSFEADSKDREVKMKKNIVRKGREED